MWGGGQEGGSDANKEEEGGGWSLTVYRKCTLFICADIKSDAETCYQLWFGTRDKHTAGTSDLRYKIFQSSQELRQAC